MSDDNKKSLKFHYIKSPQSRDLHVSGVFGGMNPQTGDLHLSVFTERPPIPQTIDFQLLEDGTLGSELSRDAKDGMVRVIQDTLYMDIGAAFALHQWLSAHIENFRKANPSLGVEPEQEK
jgi:hypothetical protein